MKIPALLAQGLKTQRIAKTKAVKYGVNGLCGDGRNCAMANEKHMYVIQADDGMFYCGMRYWDKQLRRAKIYHSLTFAQDVVKAYEECNCKILEVTMSIVGEVDKIPTVDAEKVVHGRWIFGTANHREYMKCSECLKSQTPTGVFTYCPNCGAKMDGGN